MWLAIDQLLIDMADIGAIISKKGGVMSEFELFTLMSAVMLLACICLCLSRYKANKKPEKFTTVVDNIEYRSHFNNIDVACGLYKKGLIKNYKQYLRGSVVITYHDNGLDLIGRACGDEDIAYMINQHIDMKEVRRARTKAIHWTRLL